MSVYDKEMSRFASYHRGRDEGATGGALGEIRGRIVKALLLTCLLAAGSAAAQEPNQAFMDVTYLGAPTDWCPATAGVPLVGTMDGPEIIEGPKEWPRTVIERRGIEVRRVINGENTNSFNHKDEVAPNAPVIGRFSAKYRACQNPWNPLQVSGTWHLTANDGSEIDSGAFEDTWWGPTSRPFFKASNKSEFWYAKFGDKVLFTAARPKATTTQTFLAESDKE